MVAFQAAIKFVYRKVMEPGNWRIFSVVLFSKVKWDKSEYVRYKGIRLWSIPRKVCRMVIIEKGVARKEY